MLFLPLGKAKGTLEIQTIKPKLKVTPPPEKDNLDSKPSIDHLPNLGIARTVTSFKPSDDPPPVKKTVLFRRSLLSKPDPVITSTVEKRKFFQGLFKLSFINHYFSTRTL